MDDSFNDSVLHGLDESDPFKIARVRKSQDDVKTCNRTSSSNEDEILGRLQETEDSPSKDSQLSMTEQDGNEDEILNDIPDSPTKDIGLFSDKTASLNLEVPLRETKPLKKRLIVSPSNISTVKKLCLKRTNTVTIPKAQVCAVPEKESHKKILIAPVTTDSKEEETSKKTSKAVIMTTQEKLALRAQRFNISDSGTTKLKVVNKGTTPVTAKSDIKFGSANKAPDMEVLKKRAERFGVSVSTVMKQIEEKEKVLKRQLRFGASASLSKSSLGNETQQKKLRAQRFGLS